MDQDDNEMRTGIPPELLELPRLEVIPILQAVYGLSKDNAEQMYSVVVHGVGDVIHLEVGDDGEAHVVDWGDGGNEA